MKTKIVGICNITPDSFSDGGLYYEPEMAISRVTDLFLAGADIVDIGAESTRPGAESIGPDEEWKRLEPVLEYLADLNLLTRVSLDTMHPQSAKRFIALGGYIVNDVSGLQQEEMISVMAEHHDRLCVVSHLPTETPSQAHALANKIDEVQEVYDWHEKRVAELIKKGISTTQIILDPGIGFGKTILLNYELLGYAAMPDLPVMIGYSRKRFLGPNRLGVNTNLSAGQIAISSGAAYLRVHDVPEHIKLRDELGAS